MNVVDIIAGTTVDGPGMRTAIYFAGCMHQCPGCHNPSTWSFDAGMTMTLNDIMEVIRENDFDVTFTGGDPMYSADEILPLAREIKKAGYNIWLYTGFIFEDLVSNPPSAELIKAVDVVVDGPFIQSLRDTSLSFRGSANQRIIDVAASLRAGSAVIIDLDCHGLNIAGI